VELDQKDTEFTARESVCNRPSAQPEELGSVIEQPEGRSEDANLGMSSTELDHQDFVTETPAIVPPALQIWFADILEAVKAGNEQIQESNKALQSSVESKLSKLEESDVKMQKSIKADIKVENEKLI
jgi:hypothetical protein